MAPFPQRSRPGLLIQAACGGLHPAPASRVREAYSFSHLLRRLLRHTEVRDPELIRPHRRKPAIDEIGSAGGPRGGPFGDPPPASARGPPSPPYPPTAVPPRRPPPDDPLPRPVPPLSPGT